jgi:hypothetical protein
LPNKKSLIRGSRHQKYETFISMHQIIKPIQHSNTISTNIKKKKASTQSKHI